jgi:CheY-like chemotaxis protein
MPVSGTGHGCAELSVRCRLMHRILACNERIVQEVPMTHASAVLTRAYVPTPPPRTAAARYARILIAEDEVSVRAYVDRVLRDAGYLTVRAIDGQDALELAAHLGPIDLLVTDELMPRMLGHDLARLLRHQNPDLKVLYVTAYSDRLDAKKPTWEKHEAQLDKPVTPTELLGAVSRLLRR